MVLLLGHCYSVANPYFFVVKTEKYRYYYFCTYASYLMKEIFFVRSNIFAT